MNQSNFESAVDFISQATTTTDSQTKLKLYSLYKIATSSQSPSGSRPSIWEFQARAKWDSWKERGELDVYEGESGQVLARKEYEDEARRLGWMEEGREGEKERGREEKKEKKESMVAVSMMPIVEDPNASTTTSKLHDLAVKNKPEEVKELLRLDGVNINELDTYGYTALHLASDRGHTEVVKVLIAAGADKEIKDSEGITSWELAEEAGHEEIAMILGRS